MILHQVSAGVLALELVNISFASFSRATAIAPKKH
jgi:hypothetical protein